MLAPQVAGAATIATNTTSDQFGAFTFPPQCALREAIEAANTNALFGGCEAGSASGTDEIILQGGSSYPLTIPFVSGGSSPNGDLDVLSSIEISFAGTGGAVIDAGGATGANDRVLEVGGSSASLTASHLEITGSVVTTAAGGGINVSGGSLTLSDSTGTGNSVTGGTGFGGGGWISRAPPRSRRSTT